MELRFSFVVPVYNRPEELDELLESIRRQEFGKPFEVVIVEDGSSRDAGEVVHKYAPHLDIRYFKKPNTGPGDSRNYGMQRASGDYFLLVDSDCILPDDYLATLQATLEQNPADCFGGRDAADPSFNALQKAISYTMTAPLTTGGLRGGSGKQANFQPRSFNMGLSRRAFEASGGFGNIHPGEDPDLSLRLSRNGFKILFIPEAIVYHKRRIDFRSFFRQVYKFGLARPILNRWHPGSARPTYWFPTLFSLGLLSALALPFFLPTPLGILPLAGYLLYFLGVWFGAWATTRNFRASLLAVPALLVQFAGYGWGFFKSTILLTFSKQKPESLFPGLFFNN
ncbi:glycosyltransferase family 2 protein [Robiginitalea sp. SC105]|uniref:glycosyltransferase n=1 Tax=Robiginitalea sp. SC105 TaxID=2762332 RepID=UPI001639FC09|nr:glycosyltransferase [Robiginitalea sp. SC105]MBC2840763.1 glycosyltransferase [Robiginitalea sp. SC105]